MRSAPSERGNPDVAGAPAGGPLGRIFEIQRFSIHDGPGIRTTVFMKGCPLNCVWCHNPEGISPQPQLSFLPDKCIGCGYCFRTCANQAHQMDAENVHVLDRQRCQVCGSCTRECYASALELVGREVSVEETLAEVLRDQLFYETSGGGLTLSGGEPLMQMDFTESLLQGAQRAGLHCAIETCGHVAYGQIARVLPNVDLFLYDLKETDPRRHVEYTGVAANRILDNLRKLHDDGATIIVRLPIVPGLNDRQDHFESVARLATLLPNLQGVEIKPYHSLGVSKLDRFGMAQDKVCRVKAPDKETVASWISSLETLGVNVLNNRDREQ